MDRHGLMREHLEERKCFALTSLSMLALIRLHMKMAKQCSLIQNMKPGIWILRHLKRLSRSILMLS